MYIFFLLVAIFSASAYSGDVIFKDKNGKVLTTEEVLNTEGIIDWEAKGNKNISTQAQKLHNQGRSEGSKGNYKKAISFFEQASKLEPTWAYPVYDSAYTYQLLKDYKKALVLYKQVDKMEPRGFFTVKTAIYTLEQERKGKLPKGFYSAYLSLESASIEERRELVGLLNKNYPKFAPGWKDAAFLAGNEKEAKIAIEKGLRANPDRETLGILLINKALIMHREGKEKQAVALLSKLILDPKSTFGTEKMAKKSLQLLLKIKGKKR